MRAAFPWPRDIYITGGWVRDRLLGIPTSDIDLGLNILTGRQFGLFIEKFSADPEIETKYTRKAADLGIPHSGFTRFHIVERNADASKQLETAGGKLFGLDIDLVNFRKEVYDSQSRTPEMEFGTPIEDAFRRDATVNSLFFDLQKEQVVDLTGKGLEDLQSRVMRTPLDPRQTFMDDPLRVLRLVRIGSKLDFSIDPESTECMKTDEIREALDAMITRDRINIEVFKMMRDPNPIRAFENLFRLHLYIPVFLRLRSPLVQTLIIEFPSLGLETSSSSPWPVSWPHAYQLLDTLLKDSNSNLGALLQSMASVEYLWTMAAYSPIAGLRHKALKQAVQGVVDALRIPAKLSKTLESALKNFDSIVQMVHTITDSQHPRRGIVGMAIRDWGASWVVQLIYTLISQVVYAPKSKSVLLAKYSKFADFVRDGGLEDSHTLQPLLNGNEIQTIFKLSKGGPYLKRAINGLLEWQLDHTNSGKDEAGEWLLSQRDALGIP